MVSITMTKYTPPWTFRSWGRPLQSQSGKQIEAKLRNATQIDLTTINDRINRINGAFNDVNFMKILRLWKVYLAVVLASTACSAKNGANVVDSTINTTHSAIAFANLDQQIRQAGNEMGVEEFLLVRSRFLGDYDALDRASALGEGRYATGRELLLRARTRSAVHHFADALADVEAAERVGAKPDEIAALRASILVAMGRATEVIPQLEANLLHHPGFASRSALAVAYAAVGRIDDADRLYAEALSSLDTTLPFPYAWIYFARGLMWSEQGGDQARAERLYAQALKYVPEFVTANIHLAEIEALRGDTASAIRRLEEVVQSCHEPEALALLGVLHLWSGDAQHGNDEITEARTRYELLLSRDPLAFADHGAEFYLGPGRDPERAWVLAQQNLANRETPRAALLAIKAAEASGRYSDACTLLKKYPASATSVQLQIWSLDPNIVPSNRQSGGEGAFDPRHSH
jgi:tetratricopeptide (TPR) repeat protein